MAKKKAPAADPMAPSPALLAKLGSIVQHMVEATGHGGHPFDMSAAEALLSDTQVREWLAEMEALAMIPVKRR